MTELKRIAKYEIVGSLGRGGMGTVHRAYDPSIGRTVALKVIRHLEPDSTDASAPMTRFRNEARAAGRLNHPSIVTIYDFGADGDLAYIAMECVEGCALKDTLSHHERLPVADVMNIMLQLLDGLEYAHAQGVVHRDIKPSNLLLTPDGKLKIADFGVARIDNANLTCTGSVVGTPNYIAPEVFMGRAADPRSDIFSAGVVFYELLTGHQPFSGPMEAIAHKVCHYDPPPPSSLAHEVPVACDGIAARALAKSADQRYPSAAEFCAAIHDGFVRTFRAAPDRMLSEQTMQMTREIRLQLPHVLGHSAGTPHGPGADGPATWPKETLQTVERQLAEYIGPVAHVLVCKAAAQTTDRHRLYTMLADNLDDASRPAFLATEGKAAADLAHVDRLGPPTAHPPSSTGSGAPLPSWTNAEAVEHARTCLARRLGPVAGLLVRQALREARSESELHDLLAARLPEGADRRRLLEELLKGS